MNPKQYEQFEIPNKMNQNQQPHIVSSAQQPARSPCTDLSAHRPWRIRRWSGTNEASGGLEPPGGSKSKAQRGPQVAGWIFLLPIGFLGYPVFLTQSQLFVVFFFLRIQPTFWRLVSLLLFLRIDSPSDLGQMPMLRSVSQWRVAYKSQVYRCTFLVRFLVSACCQSVFSSTCLPWTGVFNHWRWLYCPRLQEDLSPLWAPES